MPVMQSGSAESRTVARTFAGARMPPHSRIRSWWAPAVACRRLASRAATLERTSGFLE